MVGNIDFHFARSFYSSRKNFAHKLFALGTRLNRTNFEGNFSFSKIKVKS